jgi:hypothetical protein
MKIYNTIATAVVASAIAIAAPAVAQTVSNNTPIVIVDGGETTSVINVAGLSGNVTGLTLSLNGLTHTYPDDLVFGLYSATRNLGFVFMSQAGGSTDVTNATLTFSDLASVQLPESFVGGGITSGTYLPSNFGEYEFTSFPNATSFSDFFGGSANGQWTLYADDVFPADTGTVLNGWSLNFTTDATAAVPETATWMMMLAGFGMVGFGMRRRSNVKTTVRYA